MPTADHDSANSTEKTTESLPGAGDILGVNEPASGPSSAALDSPGGPGLDLTLQHRGANQSDAALEFLNRMNGSIGRARDALNILADNPALHFVLSVGGLDRALQAINELDSSIERSRAAVVCVEFQPQTDGWRL